MKKFFYPFLATIVLLSACSTDLEVIGDYKETMVVYGLLDQSQTTQYIRVNKAFLGEGSALEYAKIKDSTQFVNSLNVVLKRIKGGNELGSYNLVPTNIPKDDGLFYSPDQVNAIYSVNATLFEDSEYHLTIKNNETGTEVSAQTPLVYGFNFTKPLGTSPSYTFIVPGNNNYRFFVEWNSSKNARAYQLTVRLNYTDSLISGGTVAQTLDWVFPIKKTKTLAGGEVMGIDFKGQDFLQFVGSKLEPYADLYKRIPGNVELIMVAAADDLNTFMEVNAPSTGIIQDKPEFTNITNGLGIFSSRYIRPPGQYSKILNPSSRDSLSCGQYTKDLKFVNSLGALPTCP